MTDYPQTPASIAAAKAHQAAERAWVEQQTGLRMRDFEPPVDLGRIVIHCPHCPFSASDTREGSAVRTLCAHIVQAHRGRATKEAA